MNANQPTVDEALRQVIECDQHQALDMRERDKTLVARKWVDLVASRIRVN